MIKINKRIDPNFWLTPDINRIEPKLKDKIAQTNKYGAM